MPQEEDEIIRKTWRTLRYDFTKGNNIWRKCVHTGLKKPSFHFFELHLG